MAVSPIQICSTLEEEEERRAYATASTLFSQGNGLSHSLSIGWKRKAAYVVGVVLSVFWILFAGLLAFSRNKQNMVKSQPIPYIQDFKIPDKPLYIARNAEMTQ